MSTTSPSLKELFWVFARVSLSGFGGVLPWVQQAVVDRHRWLAAHEFAAVLGLCQFMPGPNVLNLAVVIGSRFHGARGAWVAAIGLTLPPLLLVPLLGWLYGRFSHTVPAQGLLRGMFAAGAGLVIAAGFKMLLVARPHALSFVAFTAVCFLGVVMGVPLWLVIAVLAPLGVAWAMWKR